jgi:hypothetical protein
MPVLHSHSYTSLNFWAAGKCVPFDWVAFCALLLAAKQGDEALQTEERELFVGASDTTVLVLASKGEHSTCARAR